MGSMMEITVAQAIRQLPSGARIVAAPGCGTPETLLTGLAEAAPELGQPRLYSGLQLGSYPFLAAAAAGHLSYHTWHPYGAARKALAPRQVEYVPARASAIPSLLDHWQTNVAFIRVSPPDAQGWCSLGPSASYVCHAVQRAELTLAEVDPQVPVTTGDSMLHVSDIDAFVAAETPMASFPAARRDEVSDQVAHHIMELIPAAPTIQLGIGAIPEAVTAYLGELGGPIRFVGMGNDAMVDLFEQGVIPTSSPTTQPGIMAAELMGSRTLMEYAHHNPAIVLRDSRVAHSPRVLAQLPRLVSINSALEVDVAGQVASETIQGRHISGIGGSLDFMEAGFGSDGGLTIIAMTSTSGQGTRSRIVPTLNSATVSVGRHTPDVVVTEFGVAWLRGRSERERAEALCNIAHPDFQPQLAAALATDSAPG